MFRGRLPMITDRVSCVSTPGKDIDVLVTQGGIAVNPRNQELAERIRDVGLPLIDIQDLKRKAESYTGVPSKAPKGDKLVAKVISRDSGLLDNIYNVPQK